MKNRRKNPRPVRRFRCRCEYCMNVDKRKFQEQAKDDEIKEYIETREIKSVFSGMDFTAMCAYSQGYISEDQALEDTKRRRNYKIR